MNMEQRLVGLAVRWLDDAHRSDELLRQVSEDAKDAMLERSILRREHAMELLRALAEDA